MTKINKSLHINHSSLKYCMKDVYKFLSWHILVHTVLNIRPGAALLCPYVNACAEFVSNVFSASKWKFSADHESVGGQKLSSGTFSKNSPNAKWPP